MTIDTTHLVKLYWNARLIGTMQCPTPLPLALSLETNFTLTTAKIGYASNIDVQTPPSAMTFAAVQLHSRVLTSEEVAVSFDANVPVAFANARLPLLAASTPPITMRSGEVFVFQAFSSCVWCSNYTTLTVASNVSGSISGNTNTTVLVNAANPFFLSAASVTWVPRNIAPTSSPYQVFQITMLLATGCMNITTWLTNDTTHQGDLAWPTYLICAHEPQWVSALVVYTSDYSYAPPKAYVGNPGNGYLPVWTNTSGNGLAAGYLDIYTTLYTPISLYAVNNSIGILPHYWNLTTSGFTIAINLYALRIYCVSWHFAGDMWTTRSLLMSCCCCHLFSPADDGYLPNGQHLSHHRMSVRNCQGRETHIGFYVADVSG